LFGGLALQVSGTLALSVGAIGANRLLKWREWSLDIGERENFFDFFKNFIPFAVGATLALWPLKWLGDYLLAGPLALLLQHPRLFEVLTLVIGGTFCFFSGLALTVLIYPLFASGLRTLGIWTRVGKSGLYGFLMLVVGLILQFIGSL